MLNIKYFLFQLLQKNEKMFDGTLGKYTSYNYIVYLQGKTKPDHAKPSKHSGTNPQETS